MFSFIFRVNKSFLRDGGNHPVTIPIRKHRDLPQEKLDLEKIIVVLPTGERYQGRIEQRRTKGSDYYQLYFAPSVKRWNRPPFAPYLHIGDSLLVLLFREGNRSYAVLEEQ